MRKWDTSLLDAQRMETARARVATEIKSFLGDRAASQLLERVSGDGRDLLTHVEPVLADFLGIRAASRLITRVVDSAIMRI